jgi:hypothetical protein
MAQELVLQGGAHQGGLQHPDPSLGILLGCGGVLGPQPRVLAAGLILLAPTAHERLTEVVLATELGEALLATDELANNLQLELSTEHTLLHRTAPEWLLARFCCYHSIRRGLARLLHVCLSLGVHHNRTSQTVGGVTTSNTPDDANRLIAVNGVTVTNDANGNVTGDGSETYS